MYIVGTTEEDLAPQRRPWLMEKFREATLKHDDVARELLLNALLRSHIYHKEYAQADALVANTIQTMTQPYRSNNAAARFNFYLGRIRAIQLRYNEAAECFTQALRKSPDQAAGFKTIVTKFQIVVQLLLGEVPQRSTFVQEDVKDVLRPYLHLTSAVRFGQVSHFAAVLEKYASQFKADSTYALVERIHQIVVKTALRRIIHAYTRISLNDIAAKLALDDTEDVQHIVAKAIADGVIDANIDASTGIVTSTEVADVYSTSEPAMAFQRRIEFLNKVHNQAVMAMRYLPTTAEDEDRLQANGTTLTEEDLDDLDMDW